MKIKHKFYPKSKEDGELWFMSDLHYNHFHSIRHGNRPFKTLEEMNLYIEKELREKINSKDTLFDLGDLFWKIERNKAKEFLTNYIPCSFYKIIGNHDAENLWKKDINISPIPKAVGDIFDIHVITSEKKVWNITLSHYPFLTWNRRHYGQANLHGHCHGGIDNYNSLSQELRIDLSWDGELAKEAGSFLIPWELIEKKLNNINKNRSEDKLLINQYL